MHETNVAENLSQSSTHMKAYVRNLKTLILIDLIYHPVSHKFIDASWVERKIFPTKDFEGFTVLMVGKHMMKCT